MRSPRRIVLLGALLVATSSAWAHHDPFGRGIDVVPVKPTPAGRSGIGLEGAELSPKGSYRFAAYLDLNFGVLALLDGRSKLGDLIPFRADLHLLGAWQPHPRVELSADVPLTPLLVSDFRLLSEAGVPLPPPSPVGMGSVRGIARVGLLDPATFLFGLAAVGEVRLPSPSGKDFMGDAGFVLAPRLAADRSFGPVRVLVNLGYRLRPYHAQFLNLYLHNEFVSGAGAIIRLPDVKGLTDVRLVGEMHLVTPTEAPFTFKEADSLKTPWELLVGVRARVKNRWSVELDLGRGLGLSAGYGRETFRAILGVRYDFEHHDRDGDGVPDEVDGCPDVPEDKDGFQDADGCPDPDNDGDSVPDTVDGCVNEPGPAEYNGCPDRDGDQIPDNVDKCPDQPGPAETEGCPLPPEEPEVQLESDRIRVRGQILFETGEAIIQPQSYKMLDDVYQVLTDNPDVGPVVIEGHTDDRGSRAYNLDLSRRRAKAVEDYLVNKGITRKRLRSAGFGFDRPIADNATPLGRAKNRRTEFKLVNEADEKPAPAPGQ